MLDIILENKAGDQLTFGMDSPFSIVAYDGLNPADATLNMSQYSLIDGAKFNSSKVNVRNVNIAFSIDYDAERNRIKTYKVLRPGQYIKVICRGQFRTAFLEGYVVSTPITFNDAKQVMTVAIQCPMPYFQAMDPIVDYYNWVEPTFCFPYYSLGEGYDVGFYVWRNDKAIYNHGDVECGLIFDMEVTNNIGGLLTITNMDTEEYFAFDTGDGLVNGDRIVISTVPGNLYIKKNGVSIMNSVEYESEWLKLPVNGAFLKYTVGTGISRNIHTTITHRDLYTGV